VKGARITKEGDLAAGRRAGAEGLCIWLTGLSGSGKTTTAERTREVLERSGTVVTLLDGDVVRRRISPDLGFTRADRERNVLAVASMAAEIVRRGDVVICALISPYRALRAQARAIVGDHFVEVFVDTPVDVCELRDVKGLYRRARQGEVPQMTGLDDPYEPPLQPDLVLRTVDTPVDDNVRLIVRVLKDRGFRTGIGGAR
jgi:sulfate adenylyltransferase